MKQRFGASDVSLGFLKFLDDSLEGCNVKKKYIYIYIWYMYICNVSFKRAHTSIYACTQFLQNQDAGWESHFEPLDSQQPLTLGLRVSQISSFVDSWVPVGGWNCRKAGAGIYISVRVKRPSFIFTKSHTKNFSLPSASFSQCFMCPAYSLCIYIYINV